METTQQSELKEQDQPLYSQLSSNDIYLIPFANVDGKWNMPDQYLSYILDNIIVEQNFEDVFFEGHVTSHEDFVELMKKPGNIPVVIMGGDNDLYGIAWMNGHLGNMAFGHFSLTKAASESRKTVDIGKTVLDYWLSFPTIEVMFGVVPGFNERAQGFCERIGMTKLGEVPRMLLSAFHEGRHDAVVFYRSSIED